MKKLLPIILFLLGCATLSAETDRSMVIYFAKNSSVLDLSLRGNEKTLSSIVDSLNVYRNDSVYVIKNISFVGAASPDGSREYNKRLAERRARSVFAYIARYTVLPDSVKFVSSMGRDWKGLIRLATADANMPYYTETVQFLAEILSDKALTNQTVQDPTALLMKFKDGVVYEYMKEHYFPLLRATHFNIQLEKVSKDEYDNLKNRAKAPEEVVIVNIEYPVDTAIADTAIADTAVVDTAVVDTAVVDTAVADTAVADTAAVVPTDTVASDSATCRPFYMAVKSNLLYDAAITPNAAIEFYLGKGFSITAGWQYAWWKRDLSAFYWRNYGGDLEVRYWFGKKAKEKPLTGHHVGLYGQMVTYDFDFGGPGILADKWSWAVGASYGYSLPIHRVLNLDFVLGVGYHTGKYMEYIPYDGEYVWQSTKHRHWVGPTKAEVSLVWLIGCDNYNRNPKFEKKQKQIEETVETLVGEDKGGEL